MTRFEIKELLSQSDWGVTYLAYDKQEQCSVALRRYMPLGHDGVFDEELIRKYDQRCLRLYRIQHPNLRPVIDGSFDVVNETPYLVTKWIDGRPLTEALGGQSLKPGVARGLAKRALEVSLVLSKTFGEQAVWVDTDPNTIIVEDRDGRSTYTFWVCISKLFGERPREDDVASVASLVEVLAGWDSMPIDREAAGGFGAWVEAMKSSPDISVEDALEQLSAHGDQGGEEHAPKRKEKNWVVTQAPSPERAKSRQLKPARMPAKAIHVRGKAIYSPAMKVLPPKRLLSSQSSPFLIPSRGVKPMQPTQKVQLAPSPGVTDSTPPIEQELPPPDYGAIEDAVGPTVSAGNEMAEAPSGEAADKSASAKRRVMVPVCICLLPMAGIGILAQQNWPKVEGVLARVNAVASAAQALLFPADAAGSSGMEAAAVTAHEPGHQASLSAPQDAPPRPERLPVSDVFGPQDLETILKLADNTPVKLIGVLHSARDTKDGFSVILEFVGHQQGDIRAWFPKRDYDGDGELTPGVFQPFVGKRIVIGGAYFHLDEWKQPLVVKISDISQIAVHEQESAEQKEEQVDAPEVVND